MASPVIPVHVITKEGNTGTIPSDQLQQFLADGAGEPAVMVTSPDGQAGWAPRSKVPSLIKEQNFTVGQPVNMPTPLRAGLQGVPHGIKTTVEGVIQGAKGLIPTPETFQPSSGPSVASQVEQVPQAVRDINQDEFPPQTYADVVNSTASQGLPQLLAADAVEGGRTTQTAGVAAKTAAKALDVASFNRISKILKTVGKGWDDLAEIWGSKESPSAPPATEPPSAPTPAAKPSVVTAPQDVQDALQSILKPAKPEEAPVSVSDPSVAQAEAAVKGRAAEVAQKHPVKPVPDNPTAPTVGTKASADADTAFFQRAKQALGPDAKISDVAKQAQKYKDQAAQFEKIFGQPLSNYLDDSGKFQMKDFLDEVVKPKTEPPAYVISRAFGGDGVDLVKDITGQEIHKWEQAEPRVVRTAREAAKAKSQPNYVYRSRPQGQEGIPFTESHAQATDSLDQAKKYAEEGQQNPEGGQVIRIDLNKLHPSDYVSMKHPDGPTWLKFTRPLSENEVEVVK